MEAFFNSFALVFFSEIGDKTQLLTLILAARYRQPLKIMIGIFIATVLNHAMAAWLGQIVTQNIDPLYVRYGLGLIFIAFAFWILVPDKMEGEKIVERWGALVTTVVVFFLAEMGDKTQLATVALGAKYPQIYAVTFGTTLGMLLANAPAAYFGDKLLKMISLLWMRRIAFLLFFLFGLALLIDGGKMGL